MTTDKRACNIVLDQALQQKLHVWWQQQARYISGIIQNLSNSTSLEGHIKAQPDQNKKSLHNWAHYEGSQWIIW